MKKNKGIKIAIIVLLVILVIGGILLAYLYLGTDTLRTNKQLFLKYLTEDKQLGEMLEADQLTGYIEKLQTTAHTNGGSIQANFDGSEYDSIISNAKIVFSGNTDHANQYADQEISLNYQNEEILKLNYINSNDYYGIKIQDIIKKYLVVENNNLKQFAENIGVSDTSDIPDKIDTNTVQDTKTSFTEDEFNQIKEKYINNIIVQNLTDDCFSEDDTTGAYKLTVKESKLKEIKNQILTTLKDDEMIMNKLKESYIGASRCTEEEATEYIENIKGKISDEIEEVSNSTNDIDTETTTEKELLITLYINDNKIAKAEIEYDTDKVIIEIQENKIVASIQEASTSYGEDNSAKEFEEKGEITFETIKDEDSVQYKISMETKEEEISSIIAKIYISGLSSLEAVTEGFSIEIVQDAVTMNLNYENKNEFTDTVEKQELAEKDMEILNDYTQEELQSLFKKLGEAIINAKQDQIISIITNSSAGGTNTTTEEPDNNGSSLIDDIDLGEQEKQSFNEKFESFEGENVSATAVKSLINIININNDGGTHVIEEVIYNGKSIKTSEEVFEEEIDTSKEYIVAFQKNEDGYIYRVAIKEK